MYFIDDKKAAIYEIQKYLFVVGQELGLTHLSVDGFYSEETEYAVRELQRLHSLNETGVVDRNTFDMIYSEYDRITKEKRNDEAAIYSTDRPMRIGSVGNAVSELNSVIRELSRFYLDLPVPYGNFYSQDTENAVKILQRILRRSETGETTRELYSLLRDELGNLKKLKR